MSGGLLKGPAQVGLADSRIKAHRLSAPHVASGSHSLVDPLIDADRSYRSFSLTSCGRANRRGGAQTEQKEGLQKSFFIIITDN